MRVSRGDVQNLGLQRQALEDAGCEKFFEDRMSGAGLDRPGMKDLLGQLRKGDEIIVWKLDRAARNLSDLLVLLDTLESRGVAFRSLTEGLQTSGPMGRVVSQILGAFAEFERGLIVERTKAGLDAARKRGAVLGRPRALKVSQRQHVANEVTAGRMTVSDAARLFSVSTRTVRRLLNSCE
ncbi:DNA invertase Pin-like site-specific DNA recombinase [Endobacter medicaginis]|nr:recombinase family protein [Endobacter medicaginis]MBB3175247.1 DNA invertase Pin-like site-specific DNA recombinase [Endobacter medicaginis]MCX5476269.1 recombinase family protein [Endobacter medicaginis]